MNAQKLILSALVRYVKNEVEEGLKHGSHVFMCHKAARWLRETSLDYVDASEAHRRFLREVDSLFPDSVSIEDGLAWVLPIIAPHESDFADFWDVKKKAASPARTNQFRYDWLCKLEEKYS